MTINRFFSRKALAVFLTVLVSVWIGVSASATAQRMEPTFYRATNSTFINGWDWLRTNNASATWRLVVDPAELTTADMSTFYIMIEAGVTNTTSGGSGYSRPLQLLVRSGDSGEWVPVKVEMQNPFRPEDPADSAGLGYVCYGFAHLNSLELLRSFLATGDLRVRYFWTEGSHVAVNATSVSIGFSR